MPSSPMALCLLTRFTCLDSLSFPFTLLPTPRSVWLVRSIRPAVGFAMTPASPLPTPLKKPSTPPFCAPFRGSMTTPVTPLNTPMPSDWTPPMTPLTAEVGGCWTALSCCSRAKRSSMLRKAAALLMEPVILPAAPSRPPMVFLTSDREPLATPRPKSDGLLTRPLAGSKKKADRPVPTLDSSSDGLPRKSNEPSSL